MSDTVTYIQPGISPDQAAKLIGHDRDFVMSLIRAGELPARDERSPGAKIARYRIDPGALLNWQRSRAIDPPAVSPVHQPKPRMPVLETTGLLARRRAARLLKQASARGRD